MNLAVRITSASNLPYLCRLCGTETISQINVLNIFDSNGIALNIKSKIANCLGFEVSEKDLLPKILCSECVDNLEKFSEFKIKSNKTGLYLIELLTKHQLLINDNNKVLSQNVDNQDRSTIFEPEVVIEEDHINQISTSSPNIQSPALQLSNIQNSQLNNKPLLFQCNICAEVFPTHEQSLKHISIAHKNKKTKPKTRTKKSPPKSKTGMKYFEMPTSYQCAHCPKTKNTKEKLLRHIRHHLETFMNYDCTLCGMKLKSKFSLTSHMKLHNKEYDYICNYCGKGMIGKTRYEIHVRTAHTKDYPYLCTKCDKKFPSKGILKTHLQTAHNDTLNFTCDICNRSFKIESYLKAHKRKHIPIENRQRYKCHLCEASYVCVSALKDHLAGHTGELNYGCEHCDKRYKNKKGLDIHMLTHSGEKNCVCEVCGKAFALKSSLRSHKRIHTGERPYKCDECQKTFSQKSALNRHRKSSCFNNYVDSY